MENPNDKKNIRILVIDDELGIRNLLEYELGKQGYTVKTAPNGQEGVEQFKKNKFHLVISDIKMPKLDGLQVLEFVKKSDPDTEMIMITGFGTVETAVEAMRKGAYDFVQKPFNIDELLSLVEKAVEKVELKAVIALYEVSRIVFSELKMNELLPVMIKQSGKILQSADVSILLTGKNNELEVSVTSDAGNENFSDIHLGISKRFGKRAGESKLLNIYSGTMKEDPMLTQIKDSDKVHSYILAPLRGRSGVLGYLCATRLSGDQHFSESDGRYLTIFASLISQAIENAVAHKQLEEKVAALRFANEKLSEIQHDLVKVEKLASIGQLSSGLAHEINNPLTVITGLTELLLKKENNQHNKEDLLTIKDQAERCRNIVVNLRLFAERNKREKMPVDINTALEKAMESTSRDLDAAKIRLEAELSSGLPKINGSESQLKTAFMNMIDNSYDAIIAAKPAHPKIKVTTEKKGQKVIIRIKDNGCGIPDDAVNKIFDPFFTTKEVGKGMGLGLSVVYGLITEYDGTIKVESEKGKGSEFTIELPALHETAGKEER